MRDPSSKPRGKPAFDWQKLVAEATGGRTGAGAASAGLKESTGFGPNPGGLRMYSHVPADLPEGAPLVVVLHGCGQSAAAYVRGAGWATLADQLGFAVLAPGQDTANNPNGCFSWFQPGDTARDRGEAASIRQMIAMMIGRHGLDARRVFITGLSAGGAMTSAMLAAYPEVFAGGAVIAGLAYGAAGTVQQGLASMRAPPARSASEWGGLVRQASGHRGPWPKVSVWHGDADHVVAIANAEAVIAQWSDLHGVVNTPSESGRVDGYPHRVWRRPDGEAVLESFTLTGMGHGTPIAAGAAPGECGAPGPFILQTGISSSYRIAQFWGLVEPTTAAQARPLGNPTRAAAETEEVVRLDFQPVPRRRSAGASAGFDPRTVIENALRAAGLR